MKKIILSGIICLSAALCLAQQHELDSLLAVYKNYNKEDTVKLNLLLKIVFDYSYLNADTGLQKSDEAILLAQKLNIPSKLSTAYNNKGENYQSKGNNSLAIFWYNKSLEISKKINDDFAIARTLHNIGSSYYNLADYPNALENYQQSLEIFTQLKDQKNIAGNLNSMGVVYLTIPDNPRSLDYLFKALKIYESLHDELNMGPVFTNLGIINEHLLSYEKALQYHLKALDIYKREDNKYALQQTLGNIGNTYDEWGKQQEALTYYKQSIDIAQAGNFKSGVASALINMAVVYNKLHDYNKSLEHAQKSLALYNESGDKLGVSFCLSTLGTTYSLMPGDNTKKSIEYFNDAIKISKETGTIDVEGDAWENLSKIFTKQKQFDKALDAYKKYIVLKDSITNDQTKQDIQRKEMQYEFDKKETLLKAEHDKKQALAAAEISRQKVVRNATITGAFILLFAALISFIFYKRRRDAKQQQKEAEFNAQVSDTEMKALRAQMNPHFIFNSLNSIGDYISKNNLQAADNYLTKFAKLMRSILENSEQKEVSLLEDLKALELYMQLESLRLNNKFTYEIKVDENIDIENTMIPPLILQPFVENSIWHGIAKKNGNGKILVHIEKEGEMINCIVEDDGIGREKSAAAKTEEAASFKKSLGMKITKSRIDIINKIKKSNASVELSDLVEGMRAEVKLPLQLSF